MGSTVIAWVKDAPGWERAFHQLPSTIAPDFILSKAPADDWLQFAVSAEVDESKRQFIEAADAIGMEYRIDEVLPDQ